MSNVSIDHQNELLVLSLNVVEATILAAVFDAAARLPNGMVADSGWLDSAEGLDRAVALAREGKEGTTEDAETQVRVANGAVALSFAPDLAADIAGEIEMAIPGRLPEGWRATAAQIREQAAELNCSTD